MKAKLFKSEEEYEEGLREAYRLIQKENKTPEEKDWLELLSVLIEKYEDRKYPVPPPSPIEAIRFRLDQMNLSEQDLSKILGNRQRKSEVLSGKRRLSLKMIRALNEKLNIPADILIQEY